MELTIICDVKPVITLVVHDLMGEKSSRLRLGFTSGDTDPLSGMSEVDSLQKVEESNVYNFVTIDYQNWCYRFQN